MNDGSVASGNTGQIQASQNSEPQWISVSPEVIAISTGGAIGALFFLLLIIRAATKFVQEVKKDD
jgi:hypothetical protein